MYFQYIIPYFIHIYISVGPKLSRPKTQVKRKEKPNPSWLFQITR